MGSYYLKRIAALAALIVWFLYSTIAVAQSPAVLASEAAQAMQQHDFSRAEHLYAELTRLAPNMAQVYSNLGLARFYQERFEAAQSAFQQALRLNPKLFVPNFFLGKIYFKNGHYADARPLLERAVKLQPQRRQPRRFLAADLVGLKQENLAIGQYEKVLSENPQDIESLFSLAMIYLDLSKNAFHHLRNYRRSGYRELALAGLDAKRPGWKKLAIEEYRKAIVASPKLPGARIALGKLLVKLKNAQEARVVFQNELRADPFNYEALYGLAQIALKEGDFTSATSDLNKAVRIRPEFFDPLPDLVVSTQEVGNQSMYPALSASDKHGNFGAALILSRLAADRGHEMESASWRSKAKKIRDELILDYHERLQRLSQKTLSPSQRRTVGLKLLRKKRYKEGIQILSPMLTHSQSNSRLKVEVGRALFQEGRYEEACKLLSEVQPQSAEILYLMGSGYKKLSLEKMKAIFTINPHSAQAHQLFGNFYFSQEMYAEAEREYSAGLKIQPNNDNLYLNLGNAYFKQFKFTDALQAYQREIQVNPFDGEAYLMKGTCLVQLRQPRQAIPILRRALQLDPHLLNAHAQLGKVFTQMGKLEEAVEQLKLAASTDTDGSLHYQLFNLYRRLGQEEKAKQALLISQQLRREKQQAMQQGVSSAENSK